MTQLSEIDEARIERLAREHGGAYAAWLHREEAANLDPTSTEANEAINRLRELDARATPAPWPWDEKQGTIHCPQDDALLTSSVCEYGLKRSGWDGELAVAVRNALPGMLNQRDQLLERLSRAEAILGRIAKNNPEAYAEALTGE